MQNGRIEAINVTNVCLSLAGKHWYISNCCPAFLRVEKELKKGDSVQITMKDDCIVTLRKIIEDR